MLRSTLCDYIDAYIFVKGAITVKSTDDTNKINKKLTFKNIASFRSCISKYNNTFAGDTGALNIIMPMYNL